MSGNLSEVGMGLLYALTGGAEGAGTAIAQNAEADRNEAIRLDTQQQLEKMAEQRANNIAIAQQARNAVMGQVLQQRAQGILDEQKTPDQNTADTNAIATAMPTEQGGRLSPADQANISQHPDAIAAYENAYGITPSAPSPEDVSRAYQLASVQTGDPQLIDAASKMVSGEAALQQAGARSDWAQALQGNADARMKSADIAEKLEAFKESLGAAAFGKGGGITPMQDLRNREIDKAREFVTALTPAELKQKTSKFTNTGRENPDYDPMMESRMRLAGTRKVGVDDYFDSMQPTAITQSNVSSRFSADPAMKGYKLGQATPQGQEVLDPSGKLVGHYH